MPVLVIVLVVFFVVFRNIVGNVMSNPITAIANANYLSILFWAIIMGLALKQVATQKTIASVAEWSETVSKVVSWVVACAPLGIMGLVYSTVSHSGVEIFITYGRLILLLVSCMMAVSLVVNPIIIGIMLLLPWICGILPSHFSIQSSNTIL